MEDLQRRLETLALVWAHAIAYAVVVVAIATPFSLAVGIATGGGFVRGKAILFVVGWLIVAFATLRLWPTKPEDLDDTSPSGYDTVSEDDDDRLQSVARSLPPVRWLQTPPPEERISPPVKHFVAGCAVLLVSFLLESAFGVT